jgi:flavin reductase (DIM6/NTAB) family NADH-FMN oxidoreductase RutF
MNEQHLTSVDFAGMERFYRANLINSVSGYKPANLIGSIGPDGVPNLAIFSSVVHLGANPALLGFIQRPLTEYSHTYYNIIHTGYYTINHVHRSFARQAHHTSARFEREVSEFDACGLTPWWIEGFPAPFVAESRIRLGMKFVQEVPIALNGTRLIIGQIEHIFLPAAALDDTGNIALDVVDDVCISGLESWYEARSFDRFGYVRPEDVPAPH